MGAVELVEDRERGERVARKRVLRAADPRAIVRFKREFRAIEHLTHPSLVRLFELGEDAQGLFFTMEVVEGEDLASYVTPSGDSVRTESGPALAVGSGVVTASTDPTLDSGDAPTVASAHARTAASGEARSGEVLRTSRPHAIPREVDLERLAHVLPQLLEGLAFLHAHGIVHRDLKPANVLVSRHGALKILDFGILAETRDGADGEGELVGTVGYLAPEQTRGAPPSPAVDLYALGVILFELFAGRLPFVGGGLAILTEALLHPAPPLETIAPDAPRAIVDACTRLLDRDPSARPSIETLARTLLPSLGARTPVLSRPREVRGELIGRDAELTRLRAVRRAVEAGSFQLVAVAGPTGAGKSALIERLADEAERSGALVLRGRARSAERVTFHGVDEAIDALASSFGRSRRRIDPADPLDRTVASAVFPALGLPHELRPEGIGRSVAVSALARLVARAAQRAGWLVWILDDAQWADADAVSVLEQLADAAIPNVLIAATLRDDVDEGPAGAWLRARGEVIALPPLSDEVLVQVARRVVDERDTNSDAPASTIDDRALALAIRACAGRPLLVELVARAFARGDREGDPRALLAATIRDVSALARDVTATLVAADAWMSVGELAATVGAPSVGACDDAVRELSTAGVLRRSGPIGPDGRATLYHDAVRVAAVDTLGPTPVASAHGRLAERLLAERIADARVVRHLLGAARIDEAAHLARELAPQAEARGAYAHAAELYEVALRVPSDDSRELRAARAHVLDRAARPTEAAKVWRALVDDAPDREARRAAMLAEACSLLAANEVTEGRVRLDEALRLGGDPTTRPGLAGLRAGLAFLLGPPRPRALALSPGESGGESGDLTHDRHEAERDVRLGTLVGYFDPLAGLRFLRRARKTYVRRADAERVAWIDFVFAYFAYFGERRVGPVRLAERYRQSAAAHLGARRPDSVELRAFPRFLGGIAAHRDGRWDDAALALGEVVESIEKANLDGTFEHMIALVHRAQIPYFAQKLDEADRWLQHFAQASRASDDSAIRCHVDFLGVQLDVLRGRHVEAHEKGAEIRARWGAEPTFQRFVAALETSCADVFVGDAREARLRIERAIREHGRFRPMHSMYGGSFATIAALVEVAALRGKDPAASARRVRRYAAIAKGACPLGTPGATRALAYAEDEVGRPAHAIALLVRAEEEAARLSQSIDVAIARHQRGLRIGGEEGATLVRSARDAIAAAGTHERVLEEDAGRR